jgi:hypothetical protein
MRMVSPYVQPPFSPANSENAVAFAKAGNAIPNGIGRAVNADEQTIKMPSIPLTLERTA